MGKVESVLNGVKQALHDEKTVRMSSASDFDAVPVVEGGRNVEEVEMGMVDLDTLEREKAVKEVSASVEESDRLGE